MEGPTIERSNGVAFAPFNAMYPGQGAHLEAAGLPQVAAAGGGEPPSSTNRWSEVTDLSEKKGSGGSGKGWAIVPEHERQPAWDPSSSSSSSSPSSSSPSSKKRGASPAKAAPVLASASSALFHSLSPTAFGSGDSGVGTRGSPGDAAAAGGGGGARNEKKQQPGATTTTWRGSPTTEPVPSPGTRSVRSRAASPPGGYLKMPMMLEEPTFHVGERVEVRVAGRFGWHMGEVTGVNEGDGKSAVSFTYSVRRLDDNLQLVNLKPGNLRTAGAPSPGRPSSRASGGSTGGGASTSATSEAALLVQSSDKAQFLEPSAAKKPTLPSSHAPDAATTATQQQQRQRQRRRGSGSSGGRRSASPLPRHQPGGTFGTAPRSAATSGGNVGERGGGARTSGKPSGKPFTVGDRVEVLDRRRAAGAAAKWLPATISAVSLGPTPKKRAGGFVPQRAIVYAAEYDDGEVLEGIPAAGANGGSSAAVGGGGGDATTTAVQLRLPRQRAPRDWNPLMSAPSTRSSNSGSSGGGGGGGRSYPSTTPASARVVASRATATAAARRPVRQTRLSTVHAKNARNQKAPTPLPPPPPPRTTTSAAATEAPAEAEPAAVAAAAVAASATPNRTINDLEVEAQGEGGEVPPVVRALLRFAAERGFQLKEDWFAPDDGDSEGMDGANADADAAAATATTTTATAAASSSGRVLLSPAAFKRKLTNMGLALSVGRPIEEQMTIERALSTDVLERTIVSAGSASSSSQSGGSGDEEGIDVEWLLSLTQQQQQASSAAVAAGSAVGTARSSTTTRSFSSSSSSSSSPSRQPGSTSRSSSSPSSRSHSRSGPSGEGEFGGEAIGVRPSLPPFDAYSTVLRPPHPPHPQPAAAAAAAAAAASSSSSSSSLAAANAPPAPAGKEAPTWAQLEAEAEKAMRVVVRHHADAYYNLRMHLGLTELRGSHGAASSKNGGGGGPAVGVSTQQSLDEWEHLRNPAVVGAAAAAVLNGKARTDSGGGGDAAVMAAAAAASAPTDASPAPPRLVTLLDLKRALYACNLRWPSSRIAALMRRMAATAAAAAGGGGAGEEEDDDSAPASLPAAQVKRYLLKLKLTHMVHWDEWFGRKRAASSAQRKRLLGAFSGVLAGLGDFTAGGWDFPARPANGTSLGPNGDAYETWCALVERFERLPPNVTEAVLGDPRFEDLSKAEASHLAREWLDKSREARQDVADRMVKAYERQQQDQKDGGGSSYLDGEDDGYAEGGDDDEFGGGGGDGGAVSLYQSYKKYVEQCRSLRRKLLADNESGDVNAMSQAILGGDDDDDDGDGDGSDRLQPAGFNEWMERYVDPKGELRRKCRADAKAAYEEALLDSDRAPPLFVAAEDAPRGWRGVGEVKRGRPTEGPLKGRDAVVYRPFRLTKMLLGQFLEGCLKSLGAGAGPHVKHTMQEAGGGFLDWLEARKVKRQENVRGVSAWQRRKSKIALARRSTENMQAVLCMDAGGIEAAADHLEGAPPTLEAHLKDLERFEEQKAGVGGDGALALLAGSLGDGRGSTAGGGGDHGKNGGPLMRIGGGAAVSKADRTKAFKAIGAGDVETLQTLLRGDPGIANAVNGDGLTCLDFAVAKRKKGAERALRLAGAVSHGALLDAGTVQDSARTIGAFHVNVANRKGLALAGTLRALSACASAVEVEADKPKGPSNEELLTKHLTKILRSDVEKEDLKKGVHVKCLRIPPHSSFMHPLQHGQFLSGGDRNHRNLKRRLLQLEHGEHNRAADAAAAGLLPPEQAVLVDPRTGRALGHAQKLLRYLVLSGLDEKRDAAIKQQQQQRQRQQEEGRGGRRVVGANRLKQQQGAAATDAAANALVAPTTDASSSSASAKGIDHESLVAGVHVEVKLRPWGKWYAARIVGVTPAEHSSRDLEDDELDEEGDENEEAYGSDLGSDVENEAGGKAQTKAAAGGESEVAGAAGERRRDKENEPFSKAQGGGKKTKKKTTKKKGKKKNPAGGAKKTTAAAALFDSSKMPPPPTHYNVRLTKASRPKRLEEMVEDVLRKCAMKGENYSEKTDEDKKRMVRYEDPDEGAGLEGQQQILRELGDRLMENMDDALKVGWIGPRAPAGTRLNAMEARRTHAYVVPKAAVDRLLQPQFESMLADKDPEVNKAAKDLIFGFDYGKRKKSSVQMESKVLSEDTSAHVLRKALQQRLDKNTKGLFQEDTNRQIQQARKMASEREKEADRAFRQWAREKDLLAREAAERAKNAGAKAESKNAAVQRKRQKAHREWLKRLKKGSYYSVNQKEIRQRPVAKRVTQPRAWSDSPPSPSPEIV